MIKKQKKIPFLLLSFLIFLVLILYFFETIINFEISQIILYISSYGNLAPIIYILIMALAIVISPIPSLPLAIASGIIFGSVKGIIYSLIGALLGSVIAFLIARKLGREYVIKKFGDNLNFIEKLNQNKLMFYIFVFRLFPFFQFDLVSYGSGLTKISLTRFSIATFFGMIPMTALFVYFGSSLKLGIYQGVFLIVLLIILMFLIPKYLFKKIKKSN